MPKFGIKSTANLVTCDQRLQDLMQEVVKDFDCSITEGHRCECDQHADFLAGKSKLDWPNGRHNAVPSRAVDAYPYPVDMNDTKRFYYFAGYVKGIAAKMGLKIRWGGDWNQDTQVRDNNFNDLVHFELVDP